MKSVQVRLSGGKSYGIRVGAPLSGLGRGLASLVSGRRALLVAPRPVARRYAGVVLPGLKAAGFDVRLAAVPDGEEHKTLAAVGTLYREALAARLDRRCAVVALGGGVTGDMAGFMAATYMRGLPLVQVPTTLLAMVDSSIGGKTGVDLPEGKNLVGAFWQPKAVWIDPAVLGTLPDREWRTGAAEIIKYGLIADRRILDVMERETLGSLKSRPVLLAEVIRRSAACKAQVVSADEHETKGLREILNLGHTFGHALETVAGYGRYTHGEAISVGMCAAARLGSRLGTFRASDVPGVDALFLRWGLPVRAWSPVSRPKLLAAMARDKKNVGGSFRFIVPVGWCRAKAGKDVPMRLVDTVLSEVGL